jgi:hypothetical protein
MTRHPDSPKIPDVPDVEVPIPSDELAFVRGKLQGPSKGKRDEIALAQIDQGRALATIISRGQRDIRFRPGFETARSAQAWADTEIFSEKHKTHPGKPIHYVREIMGE